MSGLLSLKWNNHSRIFLNLLQNLRIKELYCDTTIVCQGKFFPVHKLVLSTCSEYFKEIFERSPCKHPFIILRDVQSLELEALLNYMYKGEVDVLQDTLSELVKTAEALQIKGLSVPDDEAQDFASQIEQVESTHDSYEVCSRVIPNEDNITNQGDDMHYESTDQMKEENLLVQIENLNHQHANEEICMPSSSPRSLSPNRDILNPKLLKVEFNEGAENIPIKSDDVNHVIHSSLEKHQFFNANKVDGELSWDELISAGPSEEGKPISHIKKKEPRLRKSVYDLLLKSNLSPRQTGNVFTCPVCGLGSTHRTSMKRHILRKHTLERPYSCEICSYKAATKDTVVEHTLRLHGNDVFKCGHCSFGTKLRRFLIRHMRKVHKISKPIMP